MENDDLKSEDQMEIMMMMQQMEKIPEFYNHLSPPSDHFSSSTTDPHCLETLQQAAESSSPPFTNNLPYNLPQTVPFPTSSRWRNSGGETDLQKQRSVAAMREMIFRIAVMQPIQIDPEAVKPPKRRNVKISTDPQSVAARHRRERISERIRILQRLVPGGTKMDTASMLDEAIHYVKFLKTQVQSLERAATNRPLPDAAAAAAAASGVGFPLEMSSGSYVPMAKPSQMTHNLEQYGDA